MSFPGKPPGNTARDILSRVIRDLKYLLPGLAGAAAYIIFMEYFFHAVCLSRVLVGLPCPGCGLTRAGVLFLQGRFAESFRMHPLFLMVPAGILLGLYERYLSTRPRHYFTAYLVVTLVLLILLYIVRMKLCFPHTAPMNYDPDNVLTHMLRFGGL